MTWEEAKARAATLNLLFAEGCIAIDNNGEMWRGSFITSGRAILLQNKTCGVIYFNDDHDDEDDEANEDDPFADLVFYRRIKERPS